MSSDSKISLLTPFKFVKV